MSNPIIFIQVHGRTDILEASLSKVGTVGELHDMLAGFGITIDAETFIFLDDSEEHATGERHEPIHGLKHGCRIHVTCHEPNCGRSCCRIKGVWVLAS